ncbi:MAG: DUF4838 domain-containing protein [Armatimonadota bacterium]|nr:DUF4838 domain-containing protein [Armatimonadota bacterium]
MKWILCIVLLVAGSVTGAAAEPQFTLVKDGKSACSIVIAEKPSHNAKAAADELRSYVVRISGAELPIYTDAANDLPSGPKILVGRSRLTDAIEGLKIPDGITTNLREEGYVIHCKGDTLVVAGNDTRVGDERTDKQRCPLAYDSITSDEMYLGTRYAVYDLLNRLGVRWFMPGEYGEVVPKSATLRVPELSVEEHPDFPVRAYGIATDDEGGVQLYMWLLHNRMNPRTVGWFGMVADGTVGNILPKDQIKAHPEWFALQPDGTRNPNEACTADELRRNDPKYAGQPRLLEEILKRFEEPVKYGQRVSCFAPADGAPICVCELCLKISNRFPDGMAYGPTTEYTTSQEYFYFVNKLLDAVAEKYPGYLIASNGYFNRYPPPEVGPEFNKHRNLTVMFADILACSMHGYDDPRCWQNRQQYNYLKQWCKLSDKVWIYGYNYSLVNTTGTVTPMTRRAIRTIPLMKEAGAIGFHDLDCSDLMHNAIASYVARFALEWNTKADMKAVLNDFYSKWFGPAAVPMRDYYNKLEAAFDDGPYHSSNVSILQSVYKPQLIAQLAGDMARAEAAAVSDTDKLHVRMERLQFDHLRMYMDFLQAQRELRFRDAARLMREMQGPKKEMQRVSKFAGTWGFDYAGMPTQVERMERLASMEMLAALPEMARFSTDKHDVGRSDRWMEPDYNDSKWQLCSTSAGWQNQKLKDEDGLPTMSREGYPYTGIGWYRFTVDLPAVPNGKEARLFLPGFVSQAWVWVNGRYAGRSEYTIPWLLPQEMDIGVSPYIKAGKNVIAVRVLEANPYVGADGIYERPFLYVK